MLPMKQVLAPTTGLDRDDLVGLSQSHSKWCLSIYLPLEESWTEISDGRILLGDLKKKAVKEMETTDVPSQLLDTLFKYGIKSPASDKAQSFMQTAWEKFVATSPPIDKLVEIVKYGTKEGLREKALRVAVARVRETSTTSGNILDLLHVLKRVKVAIDPQEEYAFVIPDRNNLIGALINELIARPLSSDNIWRLRDGDDGIMKTFPEYKELLEKKISQMQPDTLHELMRKMGLQ